MKAKAKVVRIVDVKDGTEVSRAEVRADGTVTYSGGESAQSVVTNRAHDDGIDEAEAVAVLARVGWSNGYLMVDLNNAPAA